MRMRNNTTYQFMLGQLGYSTGTSVNMLGLSSGGHLKN